MELTTLHRRALEYWAARVAAVKDDEWGKPTPCTQWSVRDLVNHVVGEELWTVPLIRGATIQEVGGQFDGDVLGEDPLERARMAPTRRRPLSIRLSPMAGAFSCRTVRRTWGSTSAS